MSPWFILWNYEMFGCKNKTIKKFCGTKDGKIMSSKVFHSTEWLIVLQKQLLEPAGLLAFFFRFDSFHSFILEWISYIHMTSTLTIS